MKTKLKFLIVSFILFATLAEAQQMLNRSLLLNKVAREYIVYIPASYNSSSSVPLMFNFHGYTMSAYDQMVWGSNMRPVADTAGFILVYPQGSLLDGKTHWNIGSWTTGSTADDIGFIEAMIDTLAASYNIDLDRVYSCGYSNGGYFCFELACQLSNRIAAIGSVAGTMSTETYNSCTPSHPTPVVTIHGTSDFSVSYYGAFPTNSESHAKVNQYWATYNKTTASPVVSDLPDINSSDGSRVELSLYSNGDNSTSIEHYKVIDGGHDWPGAWGNMDIHASKIIWNFVSKYDINGLIGCGAASFREKIATKGKLSLYPNPGKNRFTVETDSDETLDCYIYSSTGQIVLAGTIGPEANVINLSDILVGVYVLKIGRETIKLLKTE